MPSFHLGQCRVQFSPDHGDLVGDLPGSACTLLLKLPLLGREPCTDSGYFRRRQYGWLECFGICHLSLPPLVNALSLYPSDAGDVCLAARCQPKIDGGGSPVTDIPGSDKISGRSYTGCVQFRDKLCAYARHLIGMKLSLRQPGSDVGLLVFCEAAPDFAFLAVIQLGELAIDRLILKRCLVLPAIEIGFE